MRSFLATLVLFTVPVALAGCDRYPSDKQLFKRTVDSWHLEHLSADVAKRTLEAKGFEVYRKQSDPGWEDRRDILFATQTQARVIYGREWRVILHLNGEITADTEVYVFDHYL